MMKLYSLFVFCFVCNPIIAKDALTRSFIKSYIENERKPTEVIYNNLGWRANDVIKLVKTLSPVRSSSTFTGRKTIFDLRILFLIDLDTCDMTILKNSTELFRAPYRWLVIAGSGNEDRTESLWDLPLVLDSDFVLAVQNNNLFTLTELYKPSPTGPTRLLSRGYYNGTFVDTRSHREMYRRRKDVQGHTLTMVNVVQDSNSSLYHLPREDRLELQYDSLSKMNWIYVRLAMEMLNATPKYILRDNYGFLKNGTWTGMMYDLTAGTGDVGTNCVMFPFRIEAVAFTDNATPIRLRFIFRQPPLSDVTNIFTQPFTMTVWISLIACIVLSIFTVHLANKWERRYGQSEKTHLDGKISDAMLLTLSAVSQQGSSMEPKKVSGRIMFLFIFITMSATYVAYSAQVVVLLQAPSDSIKTLEQLAHSKITLAALNVGYNSAYALSGYNDTVRKEISKAIFPDKGKGSFCDLDECIEQMRKGSFAFHSLTDTVHRRVQQRFLETEKCDIMYMDYFRTFDGFMPARRGSPYLKLLMVNFKRLREAGIQVALKGRYAESQPRCQGRVTVFRSIGIQNMKPVVFLMLIGAVASVLILITEVIVSRVVARRRGSDTITPTPTHRSRRHHNIQIYAD